MSVRAGIIVTGTEVLTGTITDENGPWVSKRLLELGVDLAHITVCGDRPDDLTAQLRFLADEGVSLIVTTGGLGPTADDLTVATVAAFCGRALRLDPNLEAHITDILRSWRRFSSIDALDEALRAGIRKQALVPEGAQPIPPTGTAPGIAVPATGEIPAILVLPGPPRELQAMWPLALETAPIAAAIAERVPFRQETIRAFGLSEPELAATLRTAETAVPGFDALEITTCMRRGEVEVVTRVPDGADGSYTQLAELLQDAHGRTIFSTDGSTIDDQIAEALSGHTIVTAESCTGGMVSARLTDRPGASTYVLGGVVAYSNDAKTHLLDVPADLIAQHGAVSEEVAVAMARGALQRFGADTAVATTGVAGPGGGSEAKPVGTVWLAVALADGTTRTLLHRFPGDRASVRALSTVTVIHLLAGVLRSARE